MKAVTMYETDSGQKFDNALDAILCEFRSTLLTNDSYKIVSGTTTEQISTILKWAVTEHPNIVKALLRSEETL